MRYFSRPKLTDDIPSFPRWRGLVMLFALLDVGAGASATVPAPPAVPMSSEAALAGSEDAVALTELAARYQQGRGVKQDLPRAAQLYEQAAKLGNAEAQFNLGNLYLLGEGVPQDDDWAFTYYRAAARQGHVLAQKNINEFYRAAGVTPPPDEFPAPSGAVATPPSLPPPTTGMTGAAPPPSPPLGNDTLSDAAAAELSMQVPEQLSSDELNALQIARARGIQIDGPSLAAADQAGAILPDSGLPAGSAALPGPSLPAGAVALPGAGLPIGSAALPGAGLPAGSAALPGAGLPAGSAALPGTGLPAGAAALPAADSPAKRPMAPIVESSPGQPVAPIEESLPEPVVAPIVDGRPVLAASPPPAAPPVPAPAVASGASLAAAKAALAAGKPLVALPLLQTQAQREDPEAQWLLSNLLTTLHRTPKDGRDALLWLERAAGGGVREAQYALGLRYDQGDGVAADDAQAVTWYRAAARQGNTAALQRLRAIYREAGVPLPAIDALDRPASNRGQPPQSSPK
jgi:TPR repeat protein